MKRAAEKMARAHAEQPVLPDLSAAKVEPAVRRKARAAVAPKRQRAVWTGVRHKASVSSLQLHLPGLGGVIL